MAMDYLNGTIKSYLDSNLEDGNYIYAEGQRCHRHRRRRYGYGLRRDGASPWL